MKSFLLQDEFKNWLIGTERTSESSAKSYLSYITSVNKLIVFNHNEKRFSFFEILNLEFKNKNHNILSQYITAAIDALSRKDADKILGRAKKSLQNYKSALFSYLDFFAEQFASDSDDIKNQISDSIEVDTPSKELSQKKIIQEYPKKDLLKVFSSRIKTQDRCYADIFFPIRFVTRVFREQNKQDIFRDWLGNLLNSIIVFTEKGTTSLSQISSLIIENEAVYIITKDNTKEMVYTKLSDNTTLIPLKTNTLAQIAIDHDPPLYNIMISNKNQLPIIYLISQKLREYIKDKIDYKNLSEASRIEELSEFIQTISIQDLLSELKLITSETNLQLMDRSQNTSKGKG